MNLPESLLQPIRAYGRLIIAIGETTGLQDSLLHVHAGMAVFFLSRFISRRSFGSPLPLTCVYVAEAINEVLDRINHGRWMPDTASDIANTVFWPTLIFLVVRVRRSI